MPFSKLPAVLRLLDNLDEEDRYPLPFRFDTSTLTEIGPDGSVSLKLNTPSLYPDRNPAYQAGEAGAVADVQRRINDVQGRFAEHGILMKLDRPITPSGGVSVTFKGVAQPDFESRLQKLWEVDLQPRDLSAFATGGVGEGPVSAMRGAIRAAHHDIPRDLDGNPLPEARQILAKALIEEAMKAGIGKTQLLATIRARTLSDPDIPPLP